MDPVFSKKDNEMLLALPDLEEVKDVLFSSNLKAAPGTDGLTSLLYKECWDALGPSLHKMVVAVWQGALFERSSGCKLHRDPATGKCQVLPLGRWRGTLQQEDIPHPYMKLTGSLAMVGVELTACWMRTRQVNCEELRSRVQKTVGSRRSGKFNSLVTRPYSLNSYCLSKLWFKTSSLDLRASDVTFLHTKAKSYIYQDLLQKPSELVLFRPTDKGGFGLQHVQCKAMAHLIVTFLPTAANPRFISSQFHTALYKYHILEEQEGVPSPGFTPYYKRDFFDTIKKVHSNSPLNPVLMTVSQWYQYLIEETVTMEEGEEGRRTARTCRVEVSLNILLFCWKYLLHSY